MPELFGEEIGAEDRECPEECREKFQSGDICTKEKNGKGLKIDEESLATVVVGIEESVLARSIGAERVDTVHRLVRVEPGGDVFDIPEPQEKRRREERNQDGCCYEFFIRKKMPEKMPPHRFYLTFFVFFFLQPKEM